MKIYIEDLACDIAEKIQNKTIASNMHSDMGVLDVILCVANISDTDNCDVVTLLCEDGQLIDLNKGDDYTFITIFK